jgi:hypothetical protein
MALIILFETLATGVPAHAHLLMHRDALACLLFGKAYAQGDYQVYAHVYHDLATVTRVLVRLHLQILPLLLCVL